MKLLQDINNFILIYLPMLNRSSETIKGYKTDLYMFNDWLADKCNETPGIDMINRNNIEEYLFYLKKDRNYADASRQRHLHSISSFLNYAIREKKILTNPVKEVIRFKVAKKERHFLTEEEVTQLIHHAGISFIGCVISTLYYTGIRINELCKLELRDIDFAKNSVCIRQGKGNKDRIIPMNSKVRETLLTYAEIMRPSVCSDYFFATKKSGKVSQGYVRKLIDELVNELSWSKKVTCHTLRHSFATSLLRKNVSLVHISRLLGHSSLRVTELYVHLVQDELVDAIEKL